MDARFSAPFSVVSPDRFDPGTPMAHLRHVSVFHLVATGSCEFETARGERRTITGGDALLLPFAAAHTFWSGKTHETVFAPDIVRPGRLPGVLTINHGGGGGETRMVCGFIESSEFLHAPVFRSLPDLLIHRSAVGGVSATIATTVREILNMVEAATPGSALMLGRLMELLFVEVVRSFAASLPPNATGWFAALNAPVVGRALQAMHQHPSHRWTVDELAREVATSRTVLTERFNALLGQSPIEYLTSWRMQLASDRLRNSTSPIATIAINVGYESEAAFNRAFKRVMGVTPGVPREGRPLAA
jgi:AraC-like DNA-binding protein